MVIGQVFTGPKQVIFLPPFVKADSPDPPRLTVDKINHSCNQRHERRPDRRHK